ncbi:N2227-domain-containing protein [Epithele typhae]|uniref:N2227-domain-containing protein n=1 Tax=Epithele typhae TaxID=378194 RepID=UPI00200771CD|nr:N2227-domain-containing protein [Epithele typhae]KAH9911822.1 N2227-domain-containing protein [Epithele typhae]
MPLTKQQADDEEVHLANVVTTFKQYGPYSLNANNRRRKDIHTLPLADRELLSLLPYKQRITDTDNAILANAQFLDAVIASPEIFSQGPGDAEDEFNEDDPEMRGNDQGDVDDGDHAQLSQPSQSHSHSHGHSHGEPPSGPNVRKAEFKPSEHDMEKLRSTLKQLVRDWSAEGKIERDACYEPMKDALLQHFSDIPQEERGNFRVLVPGSGLGRLAWDVANLGFGCQGNEFSHYMLLTSFYMLNRTDQIEKHTIYPYVHSFSNIPDRAALLRPIKIPDVLPSSLTPDTDFSLVAGDFEEIYGKKSPGSDEPEEGHWDAVMTCFFIDTAKNVVNYLRIIHHILAPGGVWINLGPLLWHWENNNTNDPSVELTLEEVKELARKIGFEISNERTIDTTYTNNAHSMLGYVYHAAFWTATKVI